MEELSIEQKAQRYDDSIERAKEWYFNPNSATIGKSYLLAVLPELKEFDDEKTRKAILELVRQSSEVLDKQNQNKMIAWLEKQGEKPQGKSAVEAAKEEKVDNQNCVKPDDSVEHKFKVGDWVISKINRNVYHILNVEGNKYQAESSYGIYWYDEKYFDGFCRLWDIKDANDGDILANGYSIILFRKIGNVAFDDVIDFHAGLSLFEDRFFKQHGISHYGRIEDTKFKPATKEQRQMFLQRMHEEGYKI